VLEAFAQEFMRQFQEKVLSVDDAEAAVAALIELRLTHYHEHEEFIRIAFQASLSNRVDVAWALSPELLEIHNRYTEALREIFQRGISRQTFDQADPLYLALCLEGIVNAFLAYWSRHEPTEPLGMRMAKMKREFLGRIKLRLQDGSQQSSAASCCTRNI
jgi:AcrR family transcriptional regulator